MAFVVAVAIAGCGGGGGGTTAEISKTAFVKQANEICVKTQEQASSEFRTYLTQHGSQIQSPAQEKAAQVEVGETIVIPAKQQEVEELRALGSPHGDEKRVEAIVAAYDEGIEIAEEHPEEATKDGTEAFGKAERLATTYGLEGC